MASTQQLKQRITSVKNTKQITKAMELVAASKMRRAQDNAAISRDFRNLANQLLSRLRQLTDVDNHPLFSQRTIIRTRLHIVITSDRGLAGAYNNNVLRRLAKELNEDKTAGVKSEIIVIGKQAARFIAKFDDIDVLAVYKDFPENPTSNDIRPILNLIVEKYEVGSYMSKRGKKIDSDELAEIIADRTADKDEGSNSDINDQIKASRVSPVDAVDILFTDFKSSIRQEVKNHRLLPAAFTTVPVSADLGHAEFEPSAKEVLNNVTERLIEVELKQAFLESQASEHSMRMMAMKSATDNASDLVEDLTLAFNTARQGSITQELAEITGGAEAIK